LGCAISGKDDDADGCTPAQEISIGLDPTAWYDFFDVPVPARPDPLPNGLWDRVVNLGDVGAVLLYAGASSTGSCGDNPSGTGVDYDCDKDADTIVDGLDYDRSAGGAPDPPWEAGPPDQAVNLVDVGAVLAQAGLSCSVP
jgi:hypothetical protein